MSLRLPTQYRLDNVVRGTQQTLKMRDSGKSFEVSGDGRLESYMMDGFHSATAVQSIRDPRVAAFSREMMPLVRDHVRPEDGQKAVEKHFGPSWSFSQYRNEVTATHREGDSTMGVSVSDYSDAPERVKLWAHQQTAETTLLQTVTQKGDTEHPVEFLMWEPSRAESRKALDGLNERLSAWAKADV